MLTVILLLQPLLHPRLQGNLAKFSTGSDDVFLVNRCAARAWRLGLALESARVAISRRSSVTRRPAPNRSVW
jgi:hypothetical protein